MAWNDLGPNDWPTRADLQDAVDNGLFLLGDGVPSTQPTEFVTRSEATTWLDLDEEDIPSSITANTWMPVKYYVGLFPVVQTDFIPMASPIFIAYDSGTGWMFVADRDCRQYGICQFDPVTAKTVHDLYPIPGTIKNPPSASSGNVVPEESQFITGMVSANGKVYYHGAYTGGCKVIDCSTRAIIKTIAYGVDQNYLRQVMELIGTTVWAYYSGLNRFFIIDTVTDTQVATFIFSFVPEISDHASGRVLKVGSEIWVLFTYSGTTKSLINVYNYKNTQLDYDTDLITTITDVDSAQFDGKYNCYPMYYDEDNDKVYVPSCGDNSVYVYDGTSHSLVGTINIPLTGTGKTNAIVTAFSFRGTTGQLYFNVAFQNNGSDTPVYRVLEINRTTYAIVATLDNTTYSNMVYVASTELNYTASSGTFYNSGSPNWETDGAIKGFD